MSGRRDPNGWNEDLWHTFGGARAKTYRKTATVQAVQVPRQFSVRTLHGWAVASAGSWLATDGNGDYWPIDGDVFAQTHEEVPADE